MTAIDPQLRSDRSELKKKKVAPCHTCGGRVLRTFEHGRNFPRVHPQSVISWCVGCLGYGSPELIPDSQIEKMGWPFGGADYRDAMVIRRRRAKLVDVRRQ